MPLSKRSLALATFVTLVPAACPASAQDQVPERASIEKMDAKQLVQFVSTVTGAVGQDSLKLEPAAQRGDCLELARAANSLALGYKMLAEVDDSLAAKPAEQAVPIKLQVVQSRVVTFAARVKAEEWNSRRCASYATPAEHAGDPRYARPVKIQTAEYSLAVVEARQAAEANLASVIAAGMSKKCPETLGAMQSIQLLVPYLEKLAKDVSKRPEALGPRASRRGLELVRSQLVSAGNRLYREVGIRCVGLPPAQESDEEAPTQGATPET